MSSTEIPAHLIDLLERPVFGVLATVGRDDSAQASPMWFELIDGTIRFTHTNTRTKYRNLQRNPSMSFAVYDPDKPYRYVEVRGRLTEVVPDPTGAFYQQLARRYGDADPAAPADAAHRVILVMSVEKVIGR
ncbi:PPOX class F420-dependent oxidoreductase [Microbacterium suwonense]|uniref:PPOX class F420-dependent enzyme n=1 Tax=Microbacterium suwonense TaxID=683047 RepID=A0ABN6XA06_9MICO|nr:PPOX class F420-dependent oxidoreductase [Microbacterium suwonense]BDZ40321.1 PPOX class F420-dependent enzyme [Microbacterium suwonense]